MAQVKANKTVSNEIARFTALAESTSGKLAYCALTTSVELALHQPPWKCVAEPPARLRP